ncbi:hypothetical protein D3C75_911110 [compost metagenome]
MHGNISYDPCRQRLSLLVNDLNNAWSDGFAHGADPDRFILESRDDQRAFRLPVAVTDSDVKMLLEGVDDLLVQRLACGHGAAQLRQIILRQTFSLGH